MNKNIHLVALDMDGTLFNNQSQISLKNQSAIRRCVEQGTEVIISTGRPYVGLPTELLAELGIRYVITANGAAIYELTLDAADRKCIYESCMDATFLCPLIEMLQKKEIHIDAFIDGNGYSPSACAPRIDRMDMPESIRTYIKATRIFTDDLAAYIATNNLKVQKLITNFYLLPDGNLAHREEIKELLSHYTEITYLSGGYHNLEFTKTGTSKGAALRFLCDYLNISMEDTMAIGDTQNDLDILRTASIGVAMGNARTKVKDAADFITLTNEEDGVAHALKHFILNHKHDTSSLIDEPIQRS